MKTLVVRRWFLALLPSLILLLSSGSALAVGRLEFKSKTLKEREDKSWRVEVAIYLPRAPDTAHVPMKFEFQPEVYYERSMMDGDKLVERKVPLENRQALIESVDVGFLDSGSGNIEKRTRFSFKVTRAHGYEAGEYKLTVHDTRNGQKIGAPTRLIFEGENEVIDRRAMVFTGKKEKKKDEAAKSEGEGDKPKEDEAASEETSAEGEDSESEPSSDEEAASEEAEGEGDDPEGEIKEKPGGCGCRIQDTGAAGGAPLLLGVALAAGLFVRRRRR